MRPGGACPPDVCRMVGGAQVLRKIEECGRKDGDPRRKVRLADCSTVGSGRATMTTVGLDRATHDDHGIFADCESS